MFNTSPLRSLSTTQPIDHFLTSQSRSRLDARLWLTCRLFLAKSLIEEDSGMGKLGGTSRSVTARIGSCEHHCRQGFDEAEAFGDVEMAAEFTMLDFVHSLQHGKISDELISKLEELIIRLERCQTLSYSGQLLLMLAVTQYTDINKPGRYAKDLTHIQDPLTAYQQAASILLKQLVNLGECIDRTVKSPVLPLQNIFLQHINLLIEVKLRLGRVLTHGTVDQNGNTSQRWIDALRELELGLELVRRSAYQRKPLTAHILFSLGQVQKHMVKAGLITNRMAANSFIKAIQQTFVSDHDLGLIKQAYMEISSVYMSSIKQTLAVEEVQGTPTPEPQKDGKTVKTDKKEARPKTKKSKDGKEKLSEFEKEKRVIWSAVRGATLVSMAQHRFALLTGEPEITALKIKKKAGKSIPMFALFDLLGTDDIISYSGRDSFLGKDGEVTFGTEVNGTNTVQITWIQMLGYLSLLRRQCSYKALGVGTEEQNPFAIAPLFSSRKTQKLSQVHLFLKSELVPYAEECCGVFPIDGMTLPVVPVTTQTIVTQPTEAEIERLPTEKEEDPYKYFALVQGMSPSSAREFEVSVYWSLQPMDTQSRKDSQTPKDTQSFKNTQTHKDIQTPKDIQSPKDTHPFKVAQSPKESQSLKDTQSPKDTQEASQGERWAFMYALNTKSFNMASNSGTSYLKIGLRYLPVKAIQTLHEGLMNTLEVAENEFQPVPQANVAGRPSRVDLSVPSSQEAKSPQAAVPGRKKRTVGIRALSARQRREDVIRNKLKEHLDQIHAILNTPEEVAPKEFPFEVNLQNIVCLEAIFDPSRGYTTRPTEAFFNWLISVLKKY